MRPSQASLLIVTAIAACNPYDQRRGEFTAGSADPVSYPPAYVGAGGDRTRPGRGTFTELRAYANANAIGYYAFPFSTSQLPPFGSATGGAMVDPLRLVDNGMPYAKVPTPIAYVFDPATPCRPPAGYVYDPQRDEVPLDQQGPIFTALPTATYSAGALPTFSYVPIVSQAPSLLPGGGCQSVKSEETLKATGGGGAPDGTYLAWAIIDVTAPVYRVGETAATSGGVGVQKLGWYNHFIVAYLDGGAVPTLPAPDGTKTTMQTQSLYYPRSMVMKGSSTFPGGIGFGYDVVDAARGEAAYSPVCAVFTYDTGATMAVEQLPKDVATIKAMYGATIKPATVPYTFCLQVL